MYSERTLLYLQDIVEDSDHISDFTRGLDADTLAADFKTLWAVERLFQRITEAVIQIGVADMERIGAELPVKNIRDFGNRLRHDCRNIDPVILLRIAREHLPGLRDAAAQAART